MQILNHKNQALVIALLAGLTVLNPVSADDKQKGDQINIGLSEELSKISIKKIVGKSNFTIVHSIAEKPICGIDLKSEPVD